MFIFVFERRLAGSCCEEFLMELIVEVRPRQASVLMCVVLAGTSEGLVGPRVLEGARIGVAAPTNLAGSL